MIKMNKLKKLINKETFSYLVFGVLTTVVDFLTYIILTHLSVNYMFANVISWIFAVIFAYVTNKIFVFNSKSTKKEVLIDEILSFVSARLFSLIFSLVFIYGMVTLLGTNDLIAKILSSVFVVIINYVLSKFYIFKDNSKNNKISFMDFIYNNLSLILSFIIPLVILVIIYYMRKIYPFGDNTYLRSDCYHQYTPFMKELYNKLTNGGSLTYSWNIGLGVNFSSLYAYYLASPVNWFIGLVTPNHIPEAMNLFIVVKTALCSLTFAYYLSKHFHTKKMSIASLSVFYALSSYICAFSWNLMWLDCLVLLPLIILGLEKLVKEDKCYLYAISLGFAILSNYYIAIMICIFCVLYYIALIYSDSAKKNLKYYITKCKNFAIYSLLAGGFAAITVLPAYYALSSTASGDFEFPKTIITYFSILDMLSRSLINVDVAVFSAHDPNLYCTVAVFLLVPLYAINPKIKLKEKIAKISLLAFMLVSFNTNVLNYIWHGFHYPNSLPARESFIYIFLILAISYEALMKVKEVSLKQLASCFAGAIALILLIEKLYVSDTYSSLTIYISIVFLIFYLIVISLLRNNNYKQNFVTYLLLIIVSAEAFINAEATSLSTCTRSYYLNDNSAIDTLVEQANEAEGDNFFRIEKADRRTKNDAAWNNYRGASTFSSTANSGLSKYYGSLGFEESTNAYAYYGHTPLTEAMFSIKYVLSNSELKETEFLSAFANTAYKVTNYIDDKLTGERSYYMYKNNYVLPLAFMMPYDIEEKWNNKDANPFTVQNNLCTAITGSETPMYTRLNVTTMGEQNDIDIDFDMHLFIYVTTSLDSINVSITNSNGEVSSKNYNSMTHRHILDIGKVTSGSTVSVSSTDSEVSLIQLYAYSFDSDVFYDTFNTLNSNPMELTYFSDNKLKGTVEASKDGLLYTSIPYDKGWSVYVDGKEVKTHAFKDALLSIYLTEGSHNIEFKYSPVGFKQGIILTSLSTIIFIIIVVMNNAKNKRRKTLDTAE